MRDKKVFVDIIRGYFTAQEVELPAFDRTGLVILQEIAKPDPDMHIIEKQILRDPALTSQLLKIANSPYYRGLQEVTTVRNAIVRLGLSEVTQMVTLLSQKKSFASEDSLTRDYMDQLWVHSVACAMGGKWLAKIIAPGKVNEVFFAGLLHDMGKAFFLHAIHILKKNEQLAVDIPQSYLEEMMNTLHAPLGVKLLTLWNLPTIYCDVAGKHHNDFTEDQDVILTMVSLVNKTLNKCGIGIRHVPDLDLAQTAEAKALALDPSHLKELEQVVQNSLNFIKDNT
ncbi:MAG: HDOD domain-containing protein [Desulfomicrobium sp.]|nr:HDOD domain-containing protein [Desulfomicrobium sp.]